jgi:hypothetical protein
VSQSYTPGCSYAQYPPSPRTLSSANLTARAHQSRTRARTDTHRARARAFPLLLPPSLSAADPESLLLLELQGAGLNRAFLLGPPSARSSPKQVGAGASARVDLQRNRPVSCDATAARSIQGVLWRMWVPWPRLESCVWWTQVVTGSPRGVGGVPLAAIREDRGSGPGTPPADAAQGAQRAL